MTDHNPLTLYNSLTRTKEPFIPQDPKRVTMYNCGPTVYSYAHIGNARAAVVADVLFRVLRHIYGEEHVVYARNITDVDDRIIQSSKETGLPISEITEKYARIYNEDLAGLNCLPPTHQPHATQHIDDMIVMIAELIEKGNAYESDGHVFFDVSTYEAYGALSGNTLDALRGGDRVGEGEVARKKNAADFVLWKPELHGVGWDAPFGRGRPGWHIECSAMAKATLTEGLETDVIDIHCGGVDLKFPHHENEIAQSCCANDEEKFANYWVHNEFLNMGSEKMSKSLGNVTLVHDLLKEWDGEVIRLALLKAHYRSELSWSEDLLKESKAQLDGWYRRVLELQKWVQETDHGSFTHNFGQAYDADNSDHAMMVDLDLIGTIQNISTQMSDAVEYLNELKLNKPSIHSNHYRTEGLEFRWNEIFCLANLLGLLQKDPEDWFKGNSSDDEQSKFDAIALRRQEARAAKDWAAADAARDEATALGIVLEDGPEGTSWRKA
ncbi:cysteine--tRNA ligase [Litorimonas cladophorae]|uniref:Cysteine--tRNA ligase n=1 Tax=Litorimonas cladophorae TaxID=1220491 RepID=A0A918NFH3_9PROT|nr:cysteine--tRNA ligase [Litorimonas cladophorae]GGX63489.1 cysteine--tRNA ligase [Litorimonas cladophorae]